MSSFTYRYDVDLWIGSTIKDASILLEEFFIIAKNVQIKVKKILKCKKQSNLVRNMLSLFLKDRKISYKRIIHDSHLSAFGLLYVERLFICLWLANVHTCCFYLLR